MIALVVLGGKSMMSRPASPPRTRNGAPTRPIVAFCISFFLASSTLNVKANSEEEPSCVTFIGASVKRDSRAQAAAFLKSNVRRRACAASNSTKSSSSLASSSIRSPKR